MSSSAGFSLDDILMKLSLKQENGKEPKVEDLVVKLRRLQQAKRTLEEELWEVQKIKGVLEQEEEALCSEAFQLDVLLKEKQEAHRVLQFKCEELDQESQRKQEQNKQKEELVEQYRYRIQEATLKHRKTRHPRDFQQRSSLQRMLQLSSLKLRNTGWSSWLNSRRS
ncbi:synaptonemal complex central element protein 1-like isoform X2 [Alosa sapidissima]|uniref:synaptonemal complex central element protein 1-like isoform X2 n=1 Tax=Alosa sapidissima TaxID=34773 RepID=UPI001C08CBBD|nr:synaptonemal complex central element protein 1-like isoform X2 [Alosa sapidissima]